MLVTTAPGKLMLMGEYAVLFGAPSIVAAIDRLAHCHFASAETTAFVVKMGQEKQQSDAHPLFLAVNTACKTLGFALKDGTYLVDTSDFFTHGRKMGLGSSAAATVALCKMALLQHGVQDKLLLFSVARLAHRALCNNLGSGADVYASVFGGISWYQQDASANHPLDIAQIFSQLIFIDTKLSQSTTPFVATMTQFAQRNAEAIEAFCHHTEQLCAAFSLLSGDFSSLVTVVERAYQLLDHIGKSAHIDIMSAPHRDILELAQSLGGSAKPSGAGGGDVSLAVVPEQNKTKFFEEITKRGFERLNLSLYENVS